MQQDSQLSRSSAMTSPTLASERTVEICAGRRTSCGWWALLCAACLVSGCKVGPDFKPPAPPPLKGVFEQSAPGETLPRENLASWWMAFGDPVLDDLVREAYRNNRNLREAALRVCEARARVGVARGEWFPQFDAIGQESFRDISENASPFVSSAPRRGGFNFYSLGFDSTWEIDLFGKIARTVEASSAEFWAERDAFRDVQITLLADVASNYVVTRVLQQRLEIARRNLKLQENTLELVRRRGESGLAGQLDQAQAQTTVSSTAATIPTLLQQQIEATNRLAVLLGRVPSREVARRVGEGSLPEARDVLGVGVPADLLRRRPDIRRAAAEVAAATARIGVITAEKYPVATIRGTISVDSRLLATLFTDASLAHSIGPSIRWNVLNFGRLNNAIAAQRAACQASCVRYEQTVLVAVEEVENGLAAFHNEQLRVAELARGVEAAKLAVRVSAVRYERGLASFQRVVDTQRQLLTLEDQYATSRGTVLLNLIRVYKALGGGWTPPGSTRASDCLPSVNSRFATPQNGRPVEPADARADLPPPVPAARLFDPPEPPRHTASLFPRVQERACWCRGSGPGFE